MDRMLQTLPETPPAPGHERVSVSRSARVRDRAASSCESGIPLHREVIDWFNGITDELSVARLETLVIANGYTFDEMRRFHAEWSLATWDKGGPLMRYTFRRMTEFFPHAVIPRSGPVAHLRANERDDIAQARVRTSGGEVSLDAYLEQDLSTASSSSTGARSSSSATHGWTPTTST